MATSANYVGTFHCSVPQKTTTVVYPISRLFHNSRLLSTCLFRSRKVPAQAVLRNAPHHWLLAVARARTVWCQEGCQPEERGAAPWIEFQEPYSCPIPWEVRYTWIGVWHEAVTSKTTSYYSKIARLAGAVEDIWICKRHRRVTIRLLVCDAV